MKRHFTALILAGGLGTRLRPVVSELPKVMAVVNGRPFLMYILDQLVAAGAEEIVLCTGYLGEIIKAAFGYEYKGAVIKYSQEMHPLGTGGALRNAFDLIVSDSVLVMNGDSYCDIDLSSFLAWSFNRKYDATLVLTQVEDISRYGGVEIDKDGRILSYKEKGPNHVPGLINSGIYLFKKQLLELIPLGVKYSIEREFLPKLIENGLNGFCFNGRFIDIGTPESYHLAEEFFRENN